MNKIAFFFFINLLLHKKEAFTILYKKSSIMHQSIHISIT